ncbi:bifunctional UDP-N-acetylglucosamine diphosphorylase/glucosamine-1-phosphate N-acetyltransferase GlmU [Sulfobacillus harzensis]|uniref:Bifunctional protein GlmU n=1 Tax=Sulfobacillus harzensis TaxID=2729629 RepID=A0A7Y0L1K3_9FIRM|nr:bifunctional UDP-N-acetylglucosamine diphosphorylase/glucosamine-1-phosphate N-acetyltransferase GlmU [Sulfobacillus harzensis]NMP21520.1 bifunctional UDP-N-acetylglucosamine diphosphorylase/glucosamine-1-phosphate N-acetyltransferase GlmU [Sulfobacillus harzensis]
MAKTAAIILAAGHGTRMRSGRAKALHELGGMPLVMHVVRAVEKAGLDLPWVVVGYQAERVEETLEGHAEFVRQPEMHGTGDAVLHALSAIPDEVENVVVLYADCPLVPAALISDLIERHRQDQSAATLVTTYVQNPTGYGRIVRDAEGAVEAIVEEKEADAVVRQIQEINTGIGIWRVDGFRQLLAGLPFHGEEKYLTDAVEALRRQGARVTAMVWEDPAQVMGINTRRELAEAEARLRMDTLNRLFAAGVTIVDPATTYIDADVEIGQDTVIYPMTFIRGRTKIGRECHIGPMSTVVSSRIADGVVVEQSVIEQSVIASTARVGPFSHLRAGTYLDRDVKIGNFVELKNTRVGIGSKAGHHSYLGDATIGGRVNIGAGTVIVNFDGTAKHPTFIGDEAFIGCNSNLVAPIEVGPGAYVAAGSTLTQNVPGDALAIARGRQENKPGWAAQRRSKGRDA